MHLSFTRTFFKHTSAHHNRANSMTQSEHFAISVIIGASDKLLIFLQFASTGVNLLLQYQFVLVIFVSLETHYYQVLIFASIIVLILEVCTSWINVPCTFHVHANQWSSFPSSMTIVMCKQTIWFSEPNFLQFPSYFSLTSEIVCYR